MGAGSEGRVLRHSIDSGLPQKRVFLSEKKAAKNKIKSAGLLFILMVNLSPMSIPPLKKGLDEEMGELFNQVWENT